MDALNRNLQTRIKQLSANFPIIVILGLDSAVKVAWQNLWAVTGYTMI